MRNGAVAVEFALTAPLLFFILLAALELSHANMVLNTAEAAAYEGAREGIVPRAAVGECTAAAERTLAISNVRGASITVVPANLATDTDTVRVTVSVPYAQNTILTPLFTTGLNIVRECELNRERLQ